jgi:hypothetical protein
VVHPAVGHLRPLRRLTRGQISACLAGTIADDLRIARRHSVQRYRRTSTSRPEANVRATLAFDAVGGAHSAASRCHGVVALEQTHLGEPSMDKVSTMGSIREVGLSGVVVISKRVSHAKGAGTHWRVVALSGRNRNVSVSAPLGPRASGALVTGSG